MHPLPDEVLVPFLAGRGDRREAVEAHLRACPDCAGRAARLAGDIAALEGAGAGAAEVHRAVRLPGGARRWAAAAAVLLAAGLWAAPRAFPPSATPSSGPTSWRVAGRRVALDAGGQAGEAGSGAVRLERGRLWLEGGGASIRVITPVGELEAGTAECILGLADAEGPRGLSAFLLGEACAGESPRLLVACLTGSAIFWRGDGAWAMDAGSLLEIVPGASPVLRPLEPAERAALCAWVEPLRSGRGRP